MNKLSKYEPPMYTKVDELSYEESKMIGANDCLYDASNFIEEFLCKFDDVRQLVYLKVGLIVLLLLLLSIVAFIVYKKYIKK